MSYKKELINKKTIIYLYYTTLFNINISRQLINYKIFILITNISD